MRQADTPLFPLPCGVLFMWRHKPYLSAFLLGLGSLLLVGPSPAIGQEKKKDAGVLLSKTDSLADSDPKDTKLTDSHRKLYKIKLTEGKVYRIDLSSKDFDTYLRLEDAKGKEVAFNDDIDLANKILDSRIIYVAPKSGEYRIIATTYDAAKTGLFVLEVTMASEAEAKEARFLARVESFWDKPRAEQKK